MGALTPSELHGSLDIPFVLFFRSVGLRGLELIILYWVFLHVDCSLVKNFNASFWQFQLVAEERMLDLFLTPGGSDGHTSVFVLLYFGVFGQVVSLEVSDFTLGIVSVNVNFSTIINQITNSIEDRF
jgi:hypothetical protein